VNKDQQQAQAILDAALPPGTATVYFSAIEVFPHSGWDATKVVLALVEYGRRLEREAQAGQRGQP